MDELIELAESLRLRSHRYCEDTWYACPKHPEYCGNQKDCDCGFDDNNAKIDRIIAIANIVQNDYDPPLSF